MLRAERGQVSVCAPSDGLHKEAIGLGQLDGQLMMHCSCKSMLLHILEKQSAESSTSSIGSSVVKVAIGDGMAEVQSLDKPDWINTWKDLAEHFIARLFVECNSTQQIRLIFDRYSVSLLLGASDKALNTPFTTISRIQLISLKLP